jgi:hypothetical protein
MILDPKAKGRKDLSIKISAFAYIADTKEGGWHLGTQPMATAVARKAHSPRFYYPRC